MNLTEFLLARLDDDEAAARVFDGIRPEHYETVGLEASPDYATLYVSPTRVWAECEAKRRIVEDFEVLQADYRATHSPETEARRFQALVSVAHLAAVYTNHPDYDEDWKP